MDRYLIFLFTKWVFPFLLALLSLQITIGSILFFVFSLQQTRIYLLQEIGRVKEDIIYKNGKWDTTQYNADSNVPSSNPLYIITSDGFVIDRWRPIHGLLDVSEFTRILAYTNPQTINTITNENWRVLSKPISNGNEIVGVILVTAYKPDPANVKQIDSQLSQTINDIQKTISTDGETINVSKLDPRKLPYNITYQLVNKFNKILIQSDSVNSITRTPTFIDTSYIDNQLKAPKEEQIEDAITHQRYLVETEPLLNIHNEAIGIVVAGAAINSFYQNLFTHLASFAIISLILILCFFPLFLYGMHKTIKTLTGYMSMKKDPQKIAFLKKESKLLIDDISIGIPYASYQYYFCDALFSKSRKRWEVDELIEKFGEAFEKESWRKVYDTMVALNRKTHPYLPIKLFVVSDKTYQINPSLLSKLE